MFSQRCTKKVDQIYFVEFGVLSLNHVLSSEHLVRNLSFYFPALFRKNGCMRSGLSVIIWLHLNLSRTPSWPAEEKHWSGTGCSGGARYNTVMGFCCFLFCSHCFTANQKNTVHLWYSALSDYDLLHIMQCGLYIKSLFSVKPSSFKAVLLIFTVILCIQWLWFISIITTSRKVTVLQNNKIVCVKRRFKEQHCWPRVVDL